MVFTPRKIWMEFPKIMISSIYQVIQAVTFWSPIVGGHDSPLKGSQRTILKRSPAEWPGIFSHCQNHGYDVLKFPGLLCLGGAMVCSRGWTSGRSRCWSGQLDNPSTFLVADDSFNVGRIWWVGLWNCIFLVIWLMEQYAFYNWTIFPLSK